MKRSLIAGAALIAAVMMPAAVNAQDTIKIGVISAFSGQFADTSAQIDNGIKLYMKQHGDKVAGKKIEIIRKDTGGPNPDVAKRLAQELVVRDKADILAGFALTPEALGAASVADEAKKFMVVMNAATAVVTEKSPFIARVSLTLPMIGDTLGTWAVKKGGVKKVYTARSSGRCACRSPTRTFRLSFSAPRTSTLNRSSCSSRAAHSRQLSARRSRSAASIRRRSRS